MSKPLTFADVSMLALAAGILKDRDVYSVNLIGCAVPEFQVSPAALASAAKETGVAPSFEYNLGYGDWRAAITYGDARFYAVVANEKLQLFGYEAVYSAAAPRVVPLVTEGVQADA